MDKSITCFLPWSDAASVAASVSSMRASGVVSKIFVVVSPEHAETLQGVEADYLRSAGFATTDALRKMAAVTDTEFVVTYSKGFPLDLGSLALRRMMQICSDSGAGMVYSDYLRERTSSSSSPRHRLPGGKPS